MLHKPRNVPDITSAYILKYWEILQIYKPEKTKQTKHKTEERLEQQKQSQACLKIFNSNMPGSYQLP
jgi:hypothetical protein